MHAAGKPIVQWFIEKLLGDLSAEEEAVLAERLTSDPVFRAQWHVLEEEANGLDFPVFLEKLDARAGLERLKQELTSRAATPAPAGYPAIPAVSAPALAKRIRLRRTAWAAAVLLLIAAPASWYA